MVNQCPKGGRPNNPSQEIDNYRNSDTSDMPFSYLIEHEDASILVPGVNLRSVGTVRDARKWPRRDRRKAPGLLDRINFKLLSPYTVQRMIRGRQILANLRTVSGEDTEFYTYNNVRISRSSLQRGIELYDDRAVQKSGDHEP